MRCLVLLGAALVCCTRFGSLHVWHASFSPLFVSEVWPVWAYVVASATLDNSSSVPHPLPPYLALRTWAKNREGGREQQMLAPPCYLQHKQLNTAFQAWDVHQMQLQLSNKVGEVTLGLGLVACIDAIIPTLPSSAPNLFCQARSACCGRQAAGPCTAHQTKRVPWQLQAQNHPKASRASTAQLLAKRQQFQPVWLKTILGAQQAPPLGVLGASTGKPNTALARTPFLCLDELHSWGTARASSGSCHQHHHCQCSWPQNKSKGWAGRGFQTHQASRLIALLLNQAPLIKQSSSLAVLSALASKYFPTLLFMPG